MAYIDLSMNGVPSGSEYRLARAVEWSEWQDTPGQMASKLFHLPLLPI